MDKDKVTALSKLARIEISESEAENLAHEFEGILNYVGDVKKATIGRTAQTTPEFYRKNIMREDSNPHESGLYTKDLLKEAPHTEGAYIKVKKILKND